MTVHLKLTKEPDIPLEADTITPTHFAGKSGAEIGKLPVIQGNQTLDLATFFNISGETFLEIKKVYFF